MREIKFKYVIRTAHGINEITFDFSKHAEPFVKESLKKCGVEFHEIIAKRQYTGLKDKNGKEIYEGDIVDSKYKWKVFFENGSYWLMDNFGKETRDLYATLKLRERAGCPVEVIGNIYENPELLDKG